MVEPARECGTSEGGDMRRADVHSVLFSCFTLSLSSGVRVTVGITDTTCALNQEARALCIQVDRTLTRRAHAKEQPGATGAHCHRGGSAYKK